MFTLTLQPVPPAEDTGSLTPSSAAPAPASSHLEFLSGGSSAGGCLLSTSPFAHSLTPAPAPPSLCIGVAGPSLGSNSDVGPAGVDHANPVCFDSLALPWHTSPSSEQALSGDHQGNDPRDASGLSARSSPPAAASDHVLAHADATQVSFQLVLPGPDDSPQISHQGATVLRKGRAAPPKPLGSPAANAGPRSGRRQQKSPAKRPSLHPNVLAGGPFCFNVQMIEVQAQVEPLFSLGVLEVAA